MIIDERKLPSHFSPDTVSFLECTQYTPEGIKDDVGMYGLPSSMSEGPTKDGTLESLLICVQLHDLTSIVMENLQFINGLDHQWFVAGELLP